MDFFHWIVERFSFFPLELCAFIFSGFSIDDRSNLVKIILSDAQPFIIFNVQNIIVGLCAWAQSGWSYMWQESHTMDDKRHQTCIQKLCANLQTSEENSLSILKIAWNLENVESLKSNYIDYVVNICIMGQDVVYKTESKLSLQSAIFVVNANEYEHDRVSLYLFIITRIVAPVFEKYNICSRMYTFWNSKTKVTWYVGSIKDYEHSRFFHFSFCFVFDLSFDNGDDEKTL